MVRRRELTVPVEFESGRGVTRNVSRDGVYFVTDEAFVADAEFQFTLRLSQPAAIHCQGRVVRVDPAPHGAGVAVTIETIDFDATSKDFSDVET